MAAGFEKLRIEAKTNKRKVQFMVGPEYRRAGRETTLFTRANCTRVEERYIVTSRE